MKPTPLWRKILKILAWTVMAIVLTVAAVLICAVKLLKPEVLTPIVNRVANEVLDADVTVARAALSFDGVSPFAHIRVDSVTVISKPMLRLPAAVRDSLPVWADTLLTLERFEGSINPLALAINKVQLRNVVFTAPRVNLVSVNEKISNYLIVKPSQEEADTTPSTPPSISINSFRLDRPGPLRFSNLATGTHFEIALNALSITADSSPRYNLVLGGDLAGNDLRAYNLEKIAFGIDGGIGWNPDDPHRVVFNDFTLTADFLKAVLNATVDMRRDIVVENFSLDLGSMDLSRILAVVPEEIKHNLGIGPERFATDITMSFKARSTAPYNLTTQSIPHADMELTLTPGRLRYENVRLDRLGGRVTASLRGDNLDDAVFTLEDFIAAGPATDLHVNATATEVMTDPLIRGDINGHTVLRRLPRRLLEMLGGALSGSIDADIKFTARSSMLTRNNFHRLRVEGDIDGHRLYYLGADTATLVYINNLCLKFGTNNSHGGVDSLLSAVVRVDSADILKDNISIKLHGLALGVGAANRKGMADTTRIIPMGGGLSLERFGLTTLDDSTVVRIRGLKGRVSMDRFNNMARVPLFKFNLGLRFVSFGNRQARLLLRDGALDFTAHKLPRRPQRPEIKHTADSLRRLFPQLPVDSVYALAIRQHVRVPGRPHHIHPLYTDSASEIIYWGTTSLVRNLLLRWRIDGSLTARRAGLFTFAFPLRNRVRNFNITFCNDSINLHNVAYKAGNSDFLISGRISNLKRGFTSRGFRAPLRINFDVVSDTIDINELAGSAFAGAANIEAMNRGHAGFSLDSLVAREEHADAALEHEVGAMVVGAPDSVAPLLIPTNIDMRLDMRADNVKYADLLFHDFRGRLLAFGGALNLHRLSAASEMGTIDMSALYSAPRADSLRFGFGLQVKDFNIRRFTQLVPAIDSLMPLITDMRGIINGDIAATCDIDRGMNLVLPTLSAAIRLSGDSLELIDKETYRSIGKWLLFKNRQRNIIDHMDVEMTVADNMLHIYPFIFNIDRYKLGVQGYNDLAMNFDYHIAVLKSPLPFKFGVNIKGNPDKYKIRLGKARLKENMPVNVGIVDTTRVNLLREIENVFRRGVNRSGFRGLRISNTPTAAQIDLNSDTISAADSAAFIREGLIPAPATAPAADGAQRPAPVPADNTATTHARPEAIIPQKRK